MIKSKCYIIKCSSIFSPDAYVGFTLFKKPKRIEFETEDQAMDFATKFRFKLLPNLIIKLLNFISVNQYQFRTFSVVEIDKNQK